MSSEKLNDPAKTHVVLYSGERGTWASERLSAFDAEKLVRRLRDAGDDGAAAHECPGIYYGCIYCWP